MNKSEMTALDPSIDRLIDLDSSLSDLPIRSCHWDEYLFYANPPSLPKKPQ